MTLGAAGPQLAPEYGDAVSPGRSSYTAWLAAGRQCCVSRSVRDGGSEMKAMTNGSDGHRELVEGLAEPLTGGDVSSDLVVAAEDALDEGVTGARIRAGRRRSSPRIGPSRALQASMIGFDRVLASAFHRA